MSSKKIEEKVEEKETEKLNFWDKQVVIGDVYVNETNRITVSNVARGGVEYVSIQKMYSTKKLLTWKPGKGTAIPKKNGIAKDVLELAIKALETDILTEEEKAKEE